MSSGDVRLPLYVQYQSIHSGVDCYYKEKYFKGAIFIFLFKGKIFLEREMGLFKGA